jgi:hypothetical protein
MPRAPLDHNDRLEQQYRRLGRRDPICLSCGEANPFCLELHHLAGQAQHDDAGIVCRNCHRKLSDKQHDHAAGPTSESEGVLATIGRYLLGLADFLMMIVSTLRQFGTQLIGVHHAQAE